MPQPKAQFMTEPGNSSHAMPANGIKIIPATAETAFADTVAIEAFFSYKNKYRASFIDTKGFELKGNSSIENEIRLIIGAKTVRDIDAYAKNQKAKEE